MSETEVEGVRDLLRQIAIPSLIILFVGLFLWVIYVDRLKASQKVTSNPFPFGHIISQDN